MLGYKRKTHFPTSLRAWLRAEMRALDPDYGIPF